MRGIASIVIVLHHFTQHTSRGIFSNSALAVDMFFCLGGFVVAFSYLDRLQKSMSVKEFLIKRVIRLYPMFFIGMSLGVIAILWKYANGQTNLSVNQAIAAISLNSLYLPYISDFYVQIGKDKIPSAIFPTNDPSWSLVYVFWINIAFGIFALRVNKIRMLALTIAGMLGLIIYVVLTTKGAPGWGAGNVVGGIPRTIFGFFSGVVLFMNFDRYRRYLPVVNPNYVVALMVVVFLKGWTSYIWLGSTILFVPLLVAVGSISNPTNSYTSRVFKYLGWISYPIYCVHFPIYSIFTLLTDNADYGILTPLICLPVAIVIAHFSAKYIEEPVRIILSNRFQNLQSEAVNSPARQFQPGRVTRKM
jgi:peptidoglycan/LPS O-acetylase OafA/YrhL